MHTHNASHTRLPCVFSSQSSSIGLSLFFNSSILPLYSLTALFVDAAMGSIILQKQEVSSTQQPWQDIRDLKKAEQASRIPTGWKLSPEFTPPKETVDLRPFAAKGGILSERELNITGKAYDATSLAEAIAKKIYTAEEVAVAFCKRAAIGHQLCNNLTEIMFNDAIDEAKKLDIYLQQNSKTIGPLHGLPMTFKVRFTFHSFPCGQLTSSRSAFISRDTTTLTVIFLEHLIHPR
jgi:hypothetical protein